MGGWYSLTRWKLYALVALSFALGLLGIRMMWVQQGEDKLRQRIEKRTMERMKEAQEIRNEVDALDRKTLNDRASRWVRGSNK